MWSKLLASAVWALFESLTLIPSLKASETKVLTAAIGEVGFSHDSGADGTDVGYSSGASDTNLCEIDWP